ncbi:MAG: serine/threonine protein kinase, partial [Actinomycetota bacterium]|nr:serine/threonine protein kinase [Actinomycetota bacterium]
AQVGAALDAAHRHALVHRDVKPANILVASSDGARPPHVYLTDFGVTKHTTSRSGLTATGQFVGTVEYVAPEQIEGREVDGRADVYSLGCVMFECLTGSPPFATERDAATLWAHLSEPPPAATSRRSDLPPAIDAVVERALAKSPDERFQTCGEMIDAARNAAAEAGLGATAPAPISPSPAAQAPPSSAPGGAPGRPPSPPAGYQLAPPTPPPGVSAQQPVPLAYPPPPPGPGRAGPPIGVILAIIAGVVALAVVVVVLVVTVGGDGPPVDGPPPTAPFPNAAETELLRHIPQNLQDPPCERTTQPIPGAAASVACFTDTAQLLDYSLFRDAAAMDAAYQQRVAASGMAADTGDCSTGQPAEGTWLDPDGATSGRLLCFTNESGTPSIAWTHDELLILGEASRPIGDPVALYDFWTGIADHSATDQPSG